MIRNQLECIFCSQRNCSMVYIWSAISSVCCVCRHCLCRGNEIHQNELFEKDKKNVCKTKQAMTMCSTAEYYHQQVSQFPFKMSAGKTESGSMSNSTSDRERKSNKTSAFNKILFDLISLFVNQSFVIVADQVHTLHILR